MGHLFLLMLAVPPVGQPLASREAIALAVARLDAQTVLAPPQSSDIGWDVVRRLDRGRRVMIQIDGDDGRRDCYVLGADRDGLTVLDVTEYRMTAPEAADVVLAAATYLAAGGSDPPAVALNDVRIDAHDISIWGVKRADTSRAIRRIPRSVVFEIRTPERRRGSKAATALGAAGGFLMGFVFAVRYQENGGGQLVPWVGIFVMPTAGAYLGHRLTRYSHSDVIYRR